MSSHCFSICLLVLLGAVVTSGAPSKFITTTLKQDHGIVADELKLAEVDVIAEPLFSSVIRSTNSSCERRDDVQLMSATLDIYDQMFRRILQENQADSLLDQVPAHKRFKVENALQDLQRTMEKVKRILKQMNQEREEVMAKLKTIEVNNVLVQRKALAEFLTVYQAASVIAQCVHAHSG